ncbi:hypothetical protein BDV98DRAFT_416057 [Pterulicium gracile]|uniref:Uncharacterized protein n=1 Tax=Pterulicium gracile TaxID=1884261 RepID=A0A5C3QNE1_9AGAR|nr:hypothetical protein BDV98DRAFT_416057 [Pterula gracilis]
MQVDHCDFHVDRLIISTILRLHPLISKFYTSAPSSPSNLAYAPPPNPSQPPSAHPVSISHYDPAHHETRPYRPPPPSPPPSLQPNSRSTCRPAGSEHGEEAPPQAPSAAGPGPTKTGTLTVKSFDGPSNCNTYYPPPHRISGKFMVLIRLLGIVSIP